MASIRALNFDKGWQQLQIKHVLKLVPAMLGSSSPISSYRLRQSERRHIALYGNKNKAWMVTLLHRYLFIAHKCGIEPVLVFDELDKLGRQFEGELHPGKESICFSDPVTPLSREKCDFINALLRIRNSSGCGFLMILIVSPNFHYHLKYTRSQGMFDGISMPPTGTLLQQDLCIGPISMKVAKRYFKARRSDRQRKETSTPDSTNNRASQPDSDKSKQSGPCEDYRYLWLRSHGLYSEYQRIIDEDESLRAQQSQFEHLKAEIPEDFFKELEQLWTLNDAWKYLNFRETDNDSLNIRMKEQLWHRCFIHIGMLKFANTLIEGNDFGGGTVIPERIEKHLSERIGMCEQGIDQFPESLAGTHRPPKFALLFGEPEALCLLGEYLAFRHFGEKNLIEWVEGGSIHPGNRERAIQLNK